MYDDTPLTFRTNQNNLFYHFLDFELRAFKVYNFLRIRGSFWARCQDKVWKTEKCKITVLQIWNF